MGTWLTQHHLIRSCLELWILVSPWHRSSPIYLPGFLWPQVEYHHSHYTLSENGDAARDSSHNQTQIKGMNLLPTHNPKKGISVGGISQNNEIKTAEPSPFPLAGQGSLDGSHKEVRATVTSACLAKFLPLFNTQIHTSKI